MQASCHCKICRGKLCHPRTARTHAAQQMLEHDYDFDDDIEDTKFTTNQGGSDGCEESQRQEEMDDMVVEHEPGQDDCLEESQLEPLLDTTLNDNESLHGEEYELKLDQDEDEGGDEDVSARGTEPDDEDLKEEKSDSEEEEEEEEEADNDVSVDAAEKAWSRLMQAQLLEDERGFANVPEDATDDEVAGVATLFVVNKLDSVMKHSNMN